jgi:hypothetical protein
VQRAALRRQRFAEPVQEQLAVAVIEEDGLAIVAALDDVVRLSSDAKAARRGMAPLQPTYA